MIARLLGRVGVALTRAAHRLGTHVYVSTGCLHGDELLPDGRTGHAYCDSMTGLAGAKRPGRCKVCGEQCACAHHAAPAAEPQAQDRQSGQEPSADHFVLWLDASDGSVASHDGIRWPDGTATIHHRRHRITTTHTDPEAARLAAYGELGRIEWPANSREETP